MEINLFDTNRRKQSLTKSDKMTHNNFVEVFDRGGGGFCSWMQGSLILFLMVYPGEKNYFPT